MCVLSHEAYFMTAWTETWLGICYPLCEINFWLKKNFPKIIFFLHLSTFILIQNSRNRGKASKCFQIFKSENIFRQFAIFFCSLPQTTFFAALFKGWKIIYSRNIDKLIEFSFLFKQKIHFEFTVMPTFAPWQIACTTAMSTE